MNNQLIGTIVESIKNSNQSLTKLIITPATMRDNLELSIFQSLADSQQEIVFATDKIFVRTFEELATATLAGESPVVSYPLLTSSVRLQIIESSLKSTQPKLKVFNKSALKIGFIRKVSKLFDQFDQNAWTPAMVDELAQIVKKTNLSLSNKLADLALVYHHFYPQLANYQTKSKLIDVLSEQVGLLGDYQLIYVGESILTDAHEARLLQVLQANAQQSDLYSFPTWQTFPNHHGVIKTTKKVELPGSSETNSLFEQVNLLAPKTNLINTERFEVGKALDKPLEARWVASQIHHLVTDKTKSVRLRDIVVFLPTGDRFLSRQLSQELNKLNLDHNNYETTTLTNTPLSNVIQSILAPVELRYTIKNIERLLNSGLILANLATDTTNVKSQMIANRWVRQQFINHLKQNQIETEMDWKNDDMWTVLNQDDGLINSDKTDNLHAIRQRVQGLFEQVNEERLVASLIELLTTENPAEGQFSLLTIDKRQASNLTWYLKKYDKDAEQQLNLVSPKTGMGSLMTETRHRIIDLLSYLVGQPMTSSQLSQKIKSILSQPFAYQTNDNGIDEVKIVPINQVQLPKYRYAFVMGMSQSNYPGELKADKLFTLAEEADLPNENRFHLTQSEQMIAKENELFEAMQTSSERVYLSYSVNDLTGKLQTASPYFKVVANAKVAEGEVLNTIDNNQSLGVAEFDARPFARLATYQNIPVPLGESLAEALFTNNEHELSSSYTAIETLMENPYEYFLKYGLKLFEATEIGVTAALAGTYLHALLEQAGKLQDNVSNQAVVAKAIEATEDIANASRDQAKLAAVLKTLKATATNRYYKQRLETAFKDYWEGQQANGVFEVMKPVKTEWAFGDSTSFSGPEIELGALTLKLKGMIDRLDLYQDNGVTYLNVIDYKSGKVNQSLMKNYDLKLANGLKAQPLIYRLALENYLSTHSDELKESLSITGDVKLGAMAYAGVIDPKDKKFAGIWDMEFNDQKELLKSLYQKSDARNIDALETHLIDLIKESFNQLLTGKITIAPYRIDNNDDGIKYSKYQAIMNFDENLGNQYRNLKEEQDED